MAPAQRVVAPDSSSSRQAFIDSEPAKAAEHGGEQIGEAVGAEFLVEVGGLLPRHFEARHVEQQRDGHHAAQRADLGAALRRSRPNRPVAPGMRVDRPPQRELAEARQEPGAAHRLVADEAEQAAVENDEEGEEGDRQGQIIRDPSAEQRDGDGKQRADQNLRAVERRVEDLPARRATASGWSA